MAKMSVCNGTGKNYGGLQTSAICPTISEVTGLPPALIAYYNTTTTNNLKIQDDNIK